jgi:hypothetical protein
MDRLSRVAVHAVVRKLATALVVLVLGFLGAWCSEAQASGSFPVPSGTPPAFRAVGYNAHTEATQSALCSWLIGAFGGTLVQCTSSGGAYGWGVFEVSGGPAPSTYSIFNDGGSGGLCPANSSVSGSTCVCSTGYIVNGTNNGCSSIASACTTIIAAANSLGGSYSFTANVATAGGTSFCSGGCSIEATTGGFRKEGSQWVGTFLGPFAQGTASCSDVAPVSAGAQACPAGQVSGTVNGSTVCVPASVTADKSSTAASAPAGAASAPTAVSTPDGTEVTIPVGGSVKRETTCDAGGCTTTTTVKNSAGTTTGKFDDTKPKDTFCKENPETTICKASSFSSTCAGAGATQACDGDAIQCAIAKDQLLRHCQLFDQTGATKTIGDDAIARGDTRASDHPGATANITTAAMGPSSFDQTDLIGNTCPADQTIAVGSSSVVMPWSQLCTPAQWLGTILVGITALACVFIAFKQG